MNWITGARLAHQDALASKPLCFVCDKPHSEHGSYPTCATHPYSPDGRCGHVGTFADGRFTGLPCAGAKCRNGCARTPGVMVLPAAEHSQATDEWNEASRIRDLPAVDEAIRNMLEDQTGDNSTCMVREVLRATRGVAVPPPPGSVGEMLEWIESMTDDAPIRNMARAARAKLALGVPVPDDKTKGGK